MGDLRLLLLLPLSLVAFHGVKCCLECDPKFIEDIKSLLVKLVPSEVPGRTHLLERQIKKMIRLSFKVSHSDKMLRVLAVQKVVNLRTWLKNELYKLSNETWKGALILQVKLLDVRQNLESKLKELLKNFSEVVATEGPILDCWTCLRITTRCFKGEYCAEDDPKKAENQEFTLFLILLAEGVILGGALLLFHFCISHRRKMKAIRRSLKKYLEKKLEE
ncbi:izumo sperm-egg fusion protein 3 isoform X2 [Delphinapterus leucas]|uniref:Izumo sperm-egg fusion protein 3 isoform X2 n=1 Tax=Delphinapterus leucas TaxID=9749 RepID=A0A2Y9LPN9_DELLE|nr:izumo sperm-egg fusion protein 3 isoform X2 [Delphinapterus leucas]